MSKRDHQRPDAQPAERGHRQPTGASRERQGSNTAPPGDAGGRPVASPCAQNLGKKQPSEYVRVRIGRHHEAAAHGTGDLAHVIAPQL